MEKYREIGMKLTPQRIAIMDYLEGNTSHPSAEDIYRDVINRFPTMSFATVYNTLDILRRQGRVVELSIDPEKKRFDPETKRHHHLLCVKCKKVADIFEDFSLELSGGNIGDYEITGSHVEFYGICPNCKTAVKEA